MESKEDVYDSKIYPLMTSIIEICKRAKISLIADFGLDGDMHCTSALLETEYEPSEGQLKAYELVKPKRTFAMAETTETLTDGSKKITLRRIS